MKINKADQKKRDLIITKLLARLTDFQLMTADPKLFDWCEDLREYLCNFKGGENEKK